MTRPRFAHTLVLFLACGLANALPQQEAPQQKAAQQEPDAVSEPDIPAGACTSRGVEVPCPGPQPFGFTRGMTKAQILSLLGKDAVVVDRGDNFMVSTAPKPHPDFETYILHVSTSSGLAGVSANSKDISTNVFGESLKNKFFEVEDALEKKYGKPVTIRDEVADGSLWTEPQYWMMGLLKEDRTLEARWNYGNASIALYAIARSQETGYLLLAYELSNFGTWKREHDQKRDASY